MIKVYVINLPASVVRRQYMKKVLQPCQGISVEFIEAIDGRKTTEGDRREAFDYERSMKHYGRDLNSGEVGCALSHRKAYDTLLESGNEYALFLEDDITLIRDFNSLPFGQIDSIMKSKSPRVLFLSGDYWMFSRKPVTRVYDAVGAYAYFMNKAAAQKILNSGKPYCVADDWTATKRLNIKYFATYPYAVDANLEMDTLSSDVKQNTWSNNHSKMSRLELAKLVIPSITRKVMKKMGLFESKIRVINNKAIW